MGITIFKLFKLRRCHHEVIIKLSYEKLPSLYKLKACSIRVIRAITGLMRQNCKVACKEIKYML